MLLFDLLKLESPELDPGRCKVHLAGWNGHDNPLDVYFKGEFDSWQSWQSKRNFEREYVVSLIQLKEPNRWLYVGSYSRGGSKRVEDHFEYDLSLMPNMQRLAGRAICEFRRPSRNSYLLGETVAPSCVIHEVKSERLQLGDFPGFKNIHITFGELGVIVRQAIPSWRSALESVAGVYLITDHKDGKLYVGSATGEGGFWSRWCAYLGGHGDNVRLRQRIDKAGPAPAESFHFSVLEIADTHTKPSEVVERENHWKQVLLSREHGYNGN
ncbi:grpIintron_endo: group I intron endonuclease [Xylophilus ampelinus]|nr:grpIintron_endo: group I intron endonuclease [Xylophilus ampelinus]